MAKQTTSTPQSKVAPASKPARPRTGGSSGRSGEISRRRLSQTPLSTFVEQSIGEIKRVTWPTWPETVNLTVAVVVMTLVVAAFLGIADTALSHLVQFLIG